MPVQEHHTAVVPGERLTAEHDIGDDEG